MKLSLSKSLMAFFCLVGLVPALTITALSYQAAKTSVSQETYKLLDAVSGLNHKRIADFFQVLGNEAMLLSHSGQAAVAIEEFRRSFDQIPGAPADGQELARYYGQAFSAEYQKMNGVGPEALSTYLTSLPQASQLLQLAFVARNPHPPGKKNRLQTTADPALKEYARVHESQHPVWARILENGGYYDIFLVDDQRRVVYTVFKEMDFGADLRSGPLRQSGLGEAVELALAHPTAVQFTRLAGYFPSYNLPAMFVSQAVKLSSGKFGAIVIQVPMQKILDLASNSGDYAQLGLSSTGDILILDEEARYVTSPRWFREQRDLSTNLAKLDDSTRRLVEARSSFSLLTKVLSPAFRSFLANPEAHGEYRNSWDVDVISQKSALKVGQVHWTIVTQVSRQEAFAASEKLAFQIASTLFASMLVILLVSWLLSSKLSRRLASLSKSLLSEAEALSESSSKTEADSSSLSQAVSEQAASLQQTVSSLDEIKSMVERNNEFSQKSLQATDEAASKAATGQRLIQDMIFAMATISQENERMKQSMGGTMKAMGEMVTMIRNVQEKTKVINDIVFQTKLLSFNASVEAARSGEHGKGFSVVAEEVGNLAEMSGKSAKVISELLEESVRSVDQTTRHIEEELRQLTLSVDSKVKDGDRLAGDCGKILTEIVSTFKVVKEMVQQISLASDQQTTGIREINQAMNQLETVTQQNSSIAVDSMESAQQLQDKSSQLKVLSAHLQRMIDGESKAA